MSLQPKKGSPWTGFSVSLCHSSPIVGADNSCLQIMSRIIVILTVVISIIGCGCSRPDGKLWPFGWSKIDAPFDSVTLALEWKYVNKAPLDSLIPLSRRLRQLADEDPASNVKDVRARYWEARMKIKAGDYEEALNGFAEAAELCDSARYPYDMKRIRWNMDLEDHPLTAQWYQTRLDDAKFYEREGDLMLSGASYVEIGSMMENLGSLDYALMYYDKADSILTLGGFMNNVRYNRVNRALVDIRVRHDTVAGEKILRELADDPHIQTTGEVYDIILGDLYALCGDTLALHKAYNMVRNQPSQRYVQSMYESFLSEEALKRGDIDSARYYSDLGIAHLDEIIGAMETDALNVAEYNYKIRAKLMAATGRTDSAYHYLLLGNQSHDSLCVKERTQKILDMETMRQIGEMELTLEHAQSRQTLLMAIGILVAIFIGMLVAAYFYRRMQMQKVARMKASLELEQSQRRVVAMQLGIEEKDNLLSSVSRETANMMAKGEISHKAGSRIESSIKTHIGSQGERENFVETFATLHPDFAERLKADYPALTDADVRLASFIALGLENKHIARIMSIRPESVKQARWRLRQRMGLTAETSLDAAVARYVN